MEVTLGRMGTPGQTESEQTSPSDAAETLGMKGQDLTPEIRARFEVWGVLVTAVAPEGPVARAGIRPRAVIQDVNGTPIESAEQLRELVSSLEPGSVANLQVYVSGANTRQLVSIRVPNS